MCNHGKLGKVLWITKLPKKFHGRSFKGEAWESVNPTFLSIDISDMLDAEVA